MKFKNTRTFLSMLVALVVVSLLFALPASATNSGSFHLGGGAYVGAVQAASSSNTTGGSQFQVSVNANGNAHGYAESTGGGVASAGGNISNNGVKTFTDNSSYATGDAKSHIGGSATGTGSAAQGTDTNAAAVGQFGSIGSGFGIKGGFGH